MAPWSKNQRCRQHLPIGWRSSPLSTSRGSKMSCSSSHSFCGMGPNCDSKNNLRLSFMIDVMDFPLALIWVDSGSGCGLCFDRQKMDYRTIGMEFWEKVTRKGSILSSYNTILTA